MDPQPPRRPTIRLSPGLHQLIEQAARREGVTLAVYIREAALMRLAWEIGVSRGEDPRDVAVVLQSIRELRLICERPVPGIEPGTLNHPG